MRVLYFQDKGHYPLRGEWDNEPDKLNWVDPVTGLDCMIVRNKGVGALCGYVGVMEAHPWFGRHYTGCTLIPACEDMYACCVHSIEGKIDVHGGLTFSGFCQEGNEHGICHVPEPGRPAHVYWFGFDCSHHGDLSPEYTKDPLPIRIYRNVAYVKAEVEKLALQFHAMLKPGQEG